MLNIKHKRSGARMVPYFEYAVNLPFIDDTVFVYGEIDDGHPLIHEVEGLTEDELNEHIDEIYDEVLECWIDDYSSYLDYLYDSLKERDL